MQSFEANEDTQIIDYKAKKLIITSKNSQKLDITKFENLQELEIQKANKISKLTYEFVATNLEYELKTTFESIKKMCSNEITFENYSNECAGLLKYAILKKLSPVYILLSPWAKKLPEQILNDLTDILNLDAYKDFDLSNAKPIFLKYFNYECQ
jgi:hypothetical protein